MSRAAKPSSLEAADPVDFGEGLGAGLPRWIEAPLAAIALLVLAPLLILLAAAIKLGSPGPVLFRQRRIGRGGEPFVLVKLRSMRLSTGGAQVTSAGDRRITPVGRLLRKTKLDELPELWHVVRGEMSLVGPRPEVPAYVELDDPLWQRITSVRPGLSDPTTLRLRNEEELLASVPGDSELYYRRVLLPYKLRTTLAYLERRTPWSDVVVLCETVWRIVLPSRSPLPTHEELVPTDTKSAPSDDERVVGTRSAAGDGAAGDGAAGDGAVEDGDRW